jgi:hypothetical protein
MRRKYQYQANLLEVLLALNFHKEQYPSSMLKKTKHLPTCKDISKMPQQVRQ